MRLLVGLGNPGGRFEGTRHNIGFSCLDQVAAQLGVSSWKKDRGGELAKVEDGFLLKPQLYMNLSGAPIREIADYYRISLDDICVLADDVYLAPGTARIRRGGQDGGHNGLKSIQTHVTAEFWRVRIGVGVFGQRPEERAQGPSLEDYVLLPVPAEDAKQSQKVIDLLVPNLIKWLKHGTLAEETLRVQQPNS